MNRGIADLPNALEAWADFEAALAGRRPAVFLDYDGTLTPIVARPELAVLDEDIRAIVRDLAHRCPVCVVSGRDRLDVTRMLGIDGIGIAGSHGFDIATPNGQSVRKGMGKDQARLLDSVYRRLAADTAAFEGTLIEAKATSVAVHFRNVAEADRPRVRAAVDRVLASHPHDLKCTRGKLLREIQPRIDWDKGAAVRHLMGVLDLDRPDTVPLYFGDDLTDETAFAALSGRGVGIFVGDAADPEVGPRDTAAAFKLNDPNQVSRLLDRLAR